MQRLSVSKFGLHGAKLLIGSCHIVRPFGALLVSSFGPAMAAETRQLQLVGLVLAAAAAATAACFLRKQQRRRRIEVGAPAACRFFAYGRAVEGSC